MCHAWGFAKYFVKAGMVLQSIAGLLRILWDCLSHTVCAFLLSVDQYSIPCRMFETMIKTFKGFMIRSRFCVSY